MRKLLSGIISGVLCFVSCGAFALDLSLNDAVERVLSESHDLKKANANVDKAKAGLKAANANRWFKVDATATYMNLINVADPRNPQTITLPPELGGFIPAALSDKIPTSFEVPDNVFMAGVSVSQPIYTFGKIGNAVDSMRSAIKMSESSREITQRAIKYSAADLYWTAKMTDEIAKHNENLIPKKYAHDAYPIKSFFKHGILVSQCTDTPADDGIKYPFLCMQVAVTGASEPSTYSWQPEELINRYQFLQAMTYNGAWQLHLEKERGSIEVGKYADFVILDEDLLTCNAQALGDVQVLKTFFEGEEVYSRQ